MGTVAREGRRGVGGEGQQRVGAEGECQAGTPKKARPKTPLNDVKIFADFFGILRFIYK